MDIEAHEENSHYLHSTLRERIVEHVFVGDALRWLWQRGVTDVEVLRSEFDAGGYDLVMSYQKIVRHIQFKTTMVNGKAAGIKASLKLMDKPSGCIIWIFVTKDLDLHSYRWFGGPPGDRLPDIRNMKVAKHTKANAKGKKADRLDHRIVARGHFESLGSLDEVMERLFGQLT
ncbi:MAG: hypothetical protein ABSF28_20845 [Terracidiphilus sp.]|jgi:hypothetical protein